MDEIDNYEEYTPLGEEYTPLDIRPEPRAPEQAASELAGLAMSMDEESAVDPTLKYQTAKDELMQTGESRLLTGVVERTAMEERESSARALQEFQLSDFAQEIKDRVIQSFGEAATVVPDVQGAQIDRYGAANPEMNYDGIEAARISEERTYGIISDRIAELGDGFDLGDLVDFGGAMVPFNESKAVAGAIQEAFPEASTWDEYSSYAWLGGAKEELVDLFNSVPRSEWPGRAETLIQALRDNAGYFGGNEMIESMVLMDVLDKLRGSTETEGPDAFEVVDNLTSIADLTVVGGMAARTLRNSGKLIKGTNLSRLSKANPKTAAETVAAGIVDPEAAKAAGTTQANLGVRAWVPKLDDQGQVVEWIEDVPPAMVDRMRQQFGEGVARAIDEIENAKTTTQAERNIAKTAREQEIDKMNGVKFSLANSLVDFAGDKIRTVLKFRKADDSHFATAQEAMDAARAAFPTATNIGIEAVRIGTNVVTTVRDVFNEAEVIQRSLRDAINDRITAAANKAGKGGALSKEEAEALKKELKSIDDAIEQVGLKSIGKREANAQVKELQKARKIVEAKLKSTGKARSSAPEVKQLKEDLAKVEKGNYTDLKHPEIKDLAEQLAKPVKTEEIKDTLPKYGYTAKVETVQEADEISKFFFETGGLLNKMPDFMKPLASWLAPPASLFSRAMTRFADRAFDRSSIISRGLREMATPFLNLKRPEQVKVVDALAKGDVEGKVWTTLDLAAKFGIKDSATINAYYSWRKMEDGLWAIKDHELSRQLRAAGHKWVTVGDRKFAATGKTEEHVRGWLSDPRKPRKIYDAESDTVLDVSEALIEDIYRQGGYFAKMDGHIDQGKDRLTYMIVRRGHHIEEVPEAGVLNKLEGHVTRIYDETYFITKTIKGNLDGQPGAEIIRVLNTASTKKEAEALVKRLGGEAEGYGWRHDRKLSHQENLNMQRGLDETHGMFKHLHRGEHKRTAQGTKADILNPVESLDRAIQAASRTVTVDRMLADMKQRWINTYGHLTQGQFPRDVRQISNEGQVLNAETSKAATAMRWIQHMEGQKSAFDNLWEQAWIGIAESKLFGGEKSIKAARFVGEELNPIRALRSFGFTLFIVFNPIRQLALQTSQIMFLSALDPKYFASGKIISDSNALAMAHRVVRGVSEDPNAFKRLGKALGVSEKEAKNIAKAYDETGFYDSIDAHSFARDGMTRIGREVGRGRASQFQATMAYGGQRIKTAVKSVGFDAGERANLLMTWNLARKQYMEKFPNAKITSREVQDAIATDARAMALSMTASGELAYQKGVLSLATQFWSVQHKAFSAMLTDSTFTAAQKRRIALGQAMLWGSTGFGLREAWKDVRDSLGIDAPEFVDDLIAGGLVEAALENMFIEGDLNIGGSLAPGSGFVSTLGGTVTSLLEGDKTTAELFLGASSSAMNKIADTANSINILWYRPDVSVPEKFVGTLNNAMQMTSGASNFAKMMMGMNMKAHVDSTGDPIVEAKFSELVAKGIFGFQPEAIEDYYKILNRSGGRAPQEEVDKEATRMVNYFKNDLLKQVTPMVFDWGKDSVVDRQDKMQSALLEKFDTVIQTSMSMYDEDFGLAVGEKIRQKLVEEWRNPQTRAESLIEQLVTNARKGTSGKPLEDTRRVIMNSNLPNSDKEAWVELLDESFDNRERHLEHRGFK